MGETNFCYNGPMPTPKTSLFEEITRTVRETFGKNLIALGVFGSFARGDCTAYSDLDLFIICREAPPGRKRYQKVDFNENLLGVQVNPVIMTLQEVKKFHSLYLGFHGGFIILIDDKGILKKILNNVERLFREKVIEEDEIMGVTYWRIKDEQKISQRLF